jgi:hypothetical protein
VSQYYMEFNGRGLIPYFTSSLLKNAYLILSYEILILCKGLASEIVIVDRLTCLSTITKLCHSCVYFAVPQSAVVRKLTPSKF